MYKSTDLMTASLSVEVAVDFLVGRLQLAASVEPIVPFVATRDD
jgi:hypothetical protein